MGEWRELPLGDVLRLQRGFDLPARDRVDGPYPIVSSSGVTGRHAVAKVDPPGIVIGRYGSLGSVHWVTEPFWPLNTSLWVRDFRGNDPRYLSYLLRTVSVDGSAASAVPGVNRNHLHVLPVRVPDVRSQLRIAAVLKSFDDFIEINKRRIELLEGLARSLYREWFVRLRFSGHASTELVDSTMGPIPRSWEVRPLKDVARIVMGQSPESRHFNEDGIGTPFHQGVSRYGHLIPEHRTFSTVGSRMAERWDVLCSVRAPVGRLNLVDQDLIVGRGLAAIRRLDGYVALLLEQLRIALGAEDSLGGGTIFKAINKHELAGLMVLEPSARWRDQFERVARPILEQRVALTYANRALARTRDLLLPRLVTGRLDISDVDLGDLLPEAAAA